MEEEILLLESGLYVPTPSMGVTRKKPKPNIADSTPEGVLGKLVS
jgi:hypothetical protein